MRTLGSSKDSVLYRIAASIALAALAVPAAANQGSRRNWDELCERMIAATEQKPDEAAGMALLNEVWLPPTRNDLPTVRASDDGGAAESDFHVFAFSEQTLIPLPAAEWSGLVGLLGLALIRARKTLRKMFL